MNCPSASPIAQEGTLNKPLIDQLVDRFLACPLPESVSADIRRALAAVREGRQ